MSDHGSNHGSGNGAKKTPVSTTVDMGHVRPSSAQRVTAPQAQAVSGEDYGSERREIVVETQAPMVYRVKQRRAFFDELNSLKGDFGADKEGKMSQAQADDVDVKLMEGLVASNAAGSQVKLGTINSRDKTAFMAAVYAYLALNTGSTNAEDGFNAADGGSMISWPGGFISATEIRSVFGNGTYRYMRARATEISDVITLMYMRASKYPDAYPGAVEFVNSMNVVAEKRGLSEYPIYAAIGAEYIERVPPKIKARIMEASANVLSNRVHSRDSARETTMRAGASMYGSGGRASN